MNIFIFAFILIAVIFVICYNNTSNESFNMFLTHRRLTTSEFTRLNIILHDIIAHVVISKGKLCRKMYGEEEKFFDDGKQAITLDCFTEKTHIEDEIVEHLSTLVSMYLEKYFNMKGTENLTKYMFYNHLDLDDSLFLQINNTGRFDRYGAKYTTPSEVKQIVYDNVNTRDTLYTILNRVGIVVELDTDKHL